ncbi:angiopoietin-like protein 8 isoform X1 [Sarcophilus harrisii]|uniref:angiopoietin-like protein 8 isoform X1 n=1 Tax=Sarcophilus harrisii TaxID=9305 RepID=UPI001301B649|nr:angiopoietin-like protein 8 isoform X1 [Sarcophilus harrisii]
MSLLLCLLLMPSLALPMPTRPKPSPELALQEEVNILLHGVLQFGQALKHIYKATETQLAEASRSLGLYEQTVLMMQQDLGSARAGTQELQRNLGELQVAECGGGRPRGSRSRDALRSSWRSHGSGPSEGLAGDVSPAHLPSALLTAALPPQVEEKTLELQAQGAGIALSQVLEGHRDLQQRVEKLQGALAAMVPPRPQKELEDLKLYADKQSQIIWSLMGHVQRQQRELTQQQQQLSHIRARLQAVALPS